MNKMLSAALSLSLMWYGVIAEKLHTRLREGQLPCSDLHQYFPSFLYSNCPSFCKYDSYDKKVADGVSRGPALDWTDASAHCLECGCNDEPVALEDDVERDGVNE